MSQLRLPLFKDRRDAGRQLADAVAALELERAIVLALPRGGVPVGYEIARRLNLPLDLALVRKIGAPGYPELGLGAVVDGSAPQLVLNEAIVRALDPPRDYLAEEKRRQLAEIERRRKLYRGDRPAPDLAGRSVVIVDDGIATGGTVRVVLQAVAHAQAARTIVAVPVAPAEMVPELEREADALICLATPEPFRAVGLAYEDFTQTSDTEVIALLRDLDRRAAAA
jgi:putative phosphoribosyl transferase